MAKNYGSIDEEKQKMINNQIALDVLDKDFFPNNPFGESFDESFWKSVSAAQDSFDIFFQSAFFLRQTWLARPLANFVF